LAAALNDENLSVRFEAARGMAALHHSSGLEVLTEALDDELLRFRALGALAELGDARALPAIRTVFRKFFLSAFERTQAAGAMAKLGDPEGGKHLLERTKRKWSTDRALAIELLGELKIPGALERLLQIVRDRKDTARGAAARGLGRLGDRTALDALVSLFEERQAPEDVRLDAAEGLVLLKDPQARARVEQGAAGFESEEAREEVRAMLEEEQS
jgi:HEAT repeat protein